MNDDAHVSEQPHRDRRQPSDEEVHAYVEHLRSAPAEQVVTEVLFNVLNAAQVKLGRADARPLIDLAAAVLEHARAQIADDVVRQVDQLLAQLRIAQVQAENDPSAQESATPAGAAPASTRPATARPAADPTSGSTNLSTPASKLWVPGQSR